VPNPKDFHAFTCVINFIDDSIIANPNSPVVFGTGKLMATSGSWIVGKGFNARNDTSTNRAVGKDLRSR